MPQPFSKAPVTLFWHPILLSSPVLSLSCPALFHPLLPSLPRRMITATGIVLFARKVLALYDLADSTVVGEYYKEMSAKSDVLPE